MKKGIKYKAVAYHLGNKIDLKRIRKQSTYSLIKYENSFLLFQITGSSFVYFKDYGSIVFINCDENIKQQLFKLALRKDLNINDLPKEKYDIVVDEKLKKGVEFDHINVAEFTVDIAHVIMLNLAQSVALDFYYKMSFSLLESMKKYALQLERTGKIKLTRNRMRKFIGTTMNLKNKIAENLFIFDTSSIAWSTENLLQLDNQLAKELDIIDRHHGLQENLNIVKENLELFKDILQHKYSSLLEWIIILLILFEVVQLIIEKIY
ncbi:MAG: RMD1 family protein [Vicingaceae bacterium]